MISPAGLRIARESKQTLSADEKHTDKQQVAAIDLNRPGILTSRASPVAVQKCQRHLRESTCHVPEDGTMPAVGNDPQV